MCLYWNRIHTANLKVRVVNAGVGGSTTEDGLARLDEVLRGHVDVFVLALGANDALRDMSPSVTEKNIDSILDQVRLSHPKAILVLAGMEVPGREGTSFSQVFPAVANRQKAVLVPFLLEGVWGQRSLNQADGIHPNAAGAAVVAGTVWRTLEPLLRQEGR